MSREPRREARFETVAAPARFRHVQPRVPGDQRPARYGHAHSRRGWAGGWASTRQGRAAAGRAAFNVVFLSLLGWALVWVFASDRFYVTEIVVQGSRQISAEAIRRASGLEGYSAFWIDPRQVAAQITGSLPPITAVQVRHGMSNRVTLLVQEQEEQILWRRSGVRYWVDGSGHLHPVQDEESAVAADWAPTADLMLLVNDVRPSSTTDGTSGISHGDAAAEDALVVDADVLVALRQIIRLLPEVRVVEYAPAVGLRYLHPRGWLVYLGTGSDMARKVSVLRAIEVQFAGKGDADGDVGYEDARPDVLQPELIDLRYPDSPYYRLPTADGTTDGTTGGGED